MPHRIKEITAAHFPDPLIDYGSTEFILEFSDAAEMLQKWRNPHLGRASREGTILSLAANARAAVQAIHSKLLTTVLDAEREEDLVEKLKVNQFLIDRTLPEALELVNLDQLLTPEDILAFIQKHLQLMGEEFGELKAAKTILNQLNTITDIEIKDQFGRQRRVSRNDVLDVIGSVLGNMLMRQVSLWPVDNIMPRPRGRLQRKKTYKAAIAREGKIPPSTIKNEDIRVVDKDRLSLVYFIVDMSESMGKSVFKGGLTRLDGALLTSLGLFYYFKLLNRRKRREFDSFKMHIVPVTKNPYVISDNKKFEDFLLNAEAKGKTRLVHATQTAINHLNDSYKDNSYDVQLVYLTDGRPNVVFDSSIPGYRLSSLKNFFEKSDTKTPVKTQECMIQLNQIFNYLKNSRERNWNISYFLMASQKLLRTGFYAETKEMLSGISRPITLDPTEVDQLGRRILKETIVNAS
ncbi:MAG: VWA domain-containing protein [Candidatus Heimdallarchaeota archaeon]|nr:VWA domain-containing protein [Candidatus Heimdallarchaeota archaeon]